MMLLHLQKSVNTALPRHNFAAKPCECVPVKSNLESRRSYRCARWMAPKQDTSKYHIEQGLTWGKRRFTLSSRWPKKPLKWNAKAHLPAWSVLLCILSWDRTSFEAPFRLCYIAIQKLWHLYYDKHNASKAWGSAEYWNLGKIRFKFSNLAAESTVSQAQMLCWLRGLETDPRHMASYSWQLAKISQRNVVS